MILSQTDSATRRRAAGIALLVVASILWSFGGLGLKASGLPAVTFTFYRSLAAALTMALLIPFSAGRFPPLRWMLLSALIYTLVVSFLMASMYAGTAATGILLQYTSPVFCAFFAFLFQRRAIDRRTFLAMAVATTGILVMVLAPAEERSFAAAIYGIISGAAFGALTLILEKLDRSANGQANPFLIVLFNNLGVLLLLLPIAAATTGLAVQTRPLAWAVAIGALQLAIPYVLYQHGLRRVPPVDASLLILLEPVLNPLWVAIGVGERPNTPTLVGGAAILSALVIEATKPAKETPAP